MSDSPTTNPIDEPPQFEGGWHAPKIQGVWHEPVKVEPEPDEPTAEPAVVKALPDELAETPDDKGGWHLPRPEDTPFSPGAEIKQRPEDTLVDTLRPEDAWIPPRRSRSEPTVAEPTPAPEDMLALSDFLDDLDESVEIPGIEDELGEGYTGMNELVALASLIDEEPRIQVEDTSDLPVLLVPDEDEIGTDGVSPEQSALFEAVQTEPEPSAEAGPGVTTADIDSAAYAEQMAAQLAAEQGEAEGTSLSGLMQSDSPADTTADPSAIDSAAYAERMAAKLGQADEDFTPLPDQTSSFDTQELARRFQETRQQVLALKSQYRAGQLSYDDLQAQLRQHMILDQNNVWWMMGVETDSWYKFENNDWVAATPPVSLSGDQPPRTATSELDPDEVLAGSLAYLPDDPAAARTSFEESSPYTDEYSTPLPHRVDVQDTERTMVGQSAFENTLSSSQQTVMGQRVVEQPGFVETHQPAETVRSPAVDSGLGPVDMGRQSPIHDELAAEQQRSTLRMVVLGLVALLACGLISGTVLVVGSIYWYNQTVSPWLDEIAALADYEPEFSTARILDAEGNLIAELTSSDGGARTDVTLTDISPFMIHAVISQEDERFYDNAGFDTFAIIRAFLQNLSSGTIESGASTITQQIARNLVISNSEITADRKMTELVISTEIARRYSKNQILELYLNEIFFANRSYGVEAAAQFYFGKGASELNLAESALLTSIIPAPGVNEPVEHNAQAMQNMRATISKMVDVGCIQFQHGNWPQDGPFCINENTRVAYNDGTARLIALDSNGNISDGVVLVQIAEVETRTYRQFSTNVKYPHFVAFVQEQVDSIFGDGVMFERGFTIHTTLIPRIQETAQNSVTQRVRQLREDGRGVTTGAAMVTDPNTGAILAMVGSHDFTDDENAGQLNNTLRFHQPGSSIKPVVYAAAIEGLPNGQYLTPVSILWDVPSSYSSGNDVYRPVNYDGRFRGPVTVRSALQNSYNVPAVKAYQFIGNEKFLDIASRLGLRFASGAQFGLSSALGANDVYLYDMMEVYGAFANNGTYVPLYTITRITEDVDGQTIEVPIQLGNEGAQRAISQNVAYVIQNILSDDNARSSQFGTNTPLTISGLPTSNVVAAKTGTSDGGRDLWTMGFTKNAVVGVWLGTHDNAETVNLTGFTAVAPVWNVIMTETLRGLNTPTFQNPGGVVSQTVCRTTGTQDYEGCPTRTTDIFINGQLPPPANQGFVQTREVDSWSQLLANEWCQGNNETQVFADLGDPFAVEWLNTTSAGQSYAQSIGLPIPLQPLPEQSCFQGMELPSLSLNKPVNGATITGQETITGQVTGPEFQNFELQYALANASQNFSTITGPVTQQFPTAGSTLGTWDTTTVGNGTYIIRLIARSQAGGSIEQTITVTVTNTQAPPPQPTPIPAATSDSGGSDTVDPIPFDVLEPTATP